jgi:hypothetical protein
MATNLEKAQQRVKDLENKLKQAKALKQKAEARIKTIEAKQKRADDTRRKILVGAAILAKIGRGEWPKDKMLEMMGQQLTRTDDRALFDLPPVGVEMLSRERQISLGVSQADNGVVVSVS